MSDNSNLELSWTAQFYNWVTKLMGSSKETGVAYDQKQSKELKYEPDVIIVKLKPGIKVGSIPVNNLITRFGIKEFERVFNNLNPKRKPLRPLPDLSGFHRIKLPTGSNIFQVIEELKKLPFIESAEPNYIALPQETTPNDPYYLEQWALFKIGANFAWDIQKGSSNIVIAISGTGVDYNHEDLKDRVWQNPDEIPNNGIDDDNNGYTDDIVGWDFCGDNEPLDDGHCGSGAYAGHETEVAGLTGALANNGLGIAGVDWKAKLMILRSGGYYGPATIVYAANNGADVINMSWASDDSNLLKSAVQYAYNMGCVLVAAAGNYDGSARKYPASYPEVIGVMNFNSSDGMGISNFGPGVDIAAPGTSVVSTRRGGGYSFDITGTSYAAPHVAGLAALILAQDPSLTPKQVWAVIRNSAKDLGPPGWDYFSAWGRIDAFTALQRMDTYVYPEARIFNPPGSSYGKTIDISGRAESDSFDHYIIEWEDKSNPGIWKTENVVLKDDGKTSTSEGPLGKISFSDFAGKINIRLRVYDTSEKFSISTVENIEVDTSLKDGWPKTYGNGFSTLSGLVLADTTKNGRDEIFFFNGPLYGIDGEGAILPNWPVNLSVPSGDAGLHFMAIGDTDGDKSLDIFSGSWGASFQGSIYLQDHLGTVKPNWPLNTGRPKPVMIGEIDGKPGAELFGGLHYINTGFYSWDSAAQLLMSLPGPSPVSLAYGDLNADGNPEVAVLTSGLLSLLSKNGDILWQNPITGGNRIAIGNLDNDSELEIAVAASSGIYAYNPDGTLLSDYPKNFNVSSIALLDSDSDGINEVVASGPSGTHFFDSQGNHLWTKPENGEIIIGDVNGDSMPEVLINNGQIYAWDLFGNSAIGFPKVADSFTDFAFGNVDDDGKADLVATNGRGKVFIWNLTSTYNSFSYPWPQVNHDARRTNNFFSDIQGPSIQHIPVVKSEAGAPIVIDAEITDSSGIAQALVLYKQASLSTYEPIVMSNIGGNQWEAIIPASQVKMEGINYYLLAHDAFLNPSGIPVTFPNNVYFIKVTDSTPPLISHTPITSASEGKALPIIAQISDNSEGYLAASLFFRSTGSEIWHFMSMTNSSGTYSATIPGNYVTMPGLEYYIQASDQSNNTSTSPTKGVYSVNVIDDTPPTIIHSPISTAYLGQDLEITAEVDDNTQVRDVYLYFRIAGSSSWINLPMVNTSGIYRATIPAPEIKMGGLEYYLEAIDSTGNKSTSPANAPSLVHLVTIIDNLPPSAPSNLFASSDEDQQVTLFWLPPTTNVDGSLLTDLAGYRVAYRDLTTRENWIEVDVGNVTSKIIVGLINGHTYEFKVQAYDNAVPPNFSMWSERVIAKPSDVKVTPSPPTNLKAISGQDSQIPLFWEAPTTTIDGSPFNDLGGFKLSCKDSTLNTPWREADVGDTTSYLVTGLTNGHIYICRVKAYDRKIPPHESGWSEESAAVPSASIVSDVGITDGGKPEIDGSMEAGYDADIPDGGKPEIDGSMEAGYDAGVDISQEAKESEERVYYSHGCSCSVIRF